MEVIIVLFLLCTFLLLFIFFFARFEWIIKEARHICSLPSGYFKLGQITLLSFSVIIFIILLIHNLIIERETSSLDIFLTVIVGFLGTIFGMFFGGKGEGEVTKERILATAEAKNLIKSYEEIFEKYLKK
ncbi:hypothetical protein HZC31_00875 [Candidatus Woesearchaeota archaeon]|nr:hypothetical protein [Candidatus Woesearchaeota archaeon]